MTTSVISGLTDAEVAQRVADGKTNDVPTRAARSVSDIVRANVFTRINAILGVLLVIVLSTGSVIDGAFGLLIIANSAIGIIQELRAKQTLDKLAIVGQAKPLVRRQSGTIALLPSEVVLDDVIEIGPGDQIVVDGDVLEENNLEVDESLLTGEADSIAKDAGDKVMSGSFVVAGSRCVSGDQGRPRGLRREARRRGKQVHSGEVRTAHWADGAQVRLRRHAESMQAADRRPGARRSGRLRAVHGLQPARVRDRLRRAGRRRRSCASPTWCGSRRSSRGCAPIARSTRAVSRFVKDERAAPGAVVPRAARRRQPVRDQRDLHADPLPRAQVGRVLPARRHRRAGRGRWPSCSSGSAASCALDCPVERVERRATAGRDAHRGDVSRRRRHRALRPGRLQRRPAPHLRAPVRGHARAPRRDARGSSAWTGRCRCSSSTSGPTARTATGRAPHRGVRPALPRSCSRHLPTAPRCPTTSASTSTRRRSPTRRWRRPAAARSTCSSPVPHLGHAAIDWDALAPSATPTASSPRSSALLPDLRRHVVVRRMRHAASTFATSSTRYHGSAFSLRADADAERVVSPAQPRPAHPRPVHRRRRHAPRRRRARRDQLGQGDGPARDGRSRARGGGDGVMTAAQGAQRAGAANPAPTRASFSWAARLMPARVRDDATLLYAWCRRCDDAVDLGAPIRRPRAPPSTAAPASSTPSAAERRWPIRRCDAFRDVLGATGSRARYPDELLAGMAWTSAGSATRASQDLLRLLLPRRRHGRAHDGARHGRARRARRCATRPTSASRCSSPTSAATSSRTERRDRVYLPAELLGGDAAARRKPERARRRRCAALLRAGRRITIRSGDAGLPALPAACAWAIRAARLIYAEIGAVIARRGFDVQHGRASSRRAASCGWSPGAGRDGRRRGLAGLARSPPRMVVTAPMRGPRLGLADVAPGMTPWRAFAIYVGRIREFERA